MAKLSSHEVQFQLNYKNDNRDVDVITSTVNILAVAYFAVKFRSVYENQLLRKWSMMSG